VAVIVAVTDTVTVYVPGVDVTIPVTLSLVIDSFFVAVTLTREMCESGGPWRWLRVYRAFERRQFGRASAAARCHDRL